jgi:hypothetical protein
MLIEPIKFLHSLKEAYNEGVYFYTLTSRGFTEVKKMMLQK